MKVIKTRRKQTRNQVLKVVLIAAICMANCTSIYGRIEVKLTKGDSLAALLKAEQNDTSRALLLNQLCYEYRYSFPDKALKYGEQAIALAQQLDLSENLAKAHKNIGIVHYILGEYVKAIASYTASLKIYQSINSLEGEANIYNNIGIIYRLQGNYPQALEHYLKSLTIDTKLGKKRGMAGSYNNIGAIYYFQNNSEKAITYYSQALALFEELEDPQAMAAGYNNIGVLFEKDKDYSQALEYYNKALAIRKTMGNQQEMAASYNNIGGVYAEQLKFLHNPDSIENQFERAFAYLQKGLKIEKELGDKNGMTYSLSVIGNLYNIVKQPADAILYFEKSFTIATEMGALDRLMDAYDGLSTSYVQMRNFKEALKYYRLYTAAKDTLFNEEKSKDLGRLEAGYEFETAQAESVRAEELQLKNEVEAKTRGDNLQYSGILIFIVLLFAGVFFVGRFNIPIRLAEGMIFFSFLLVFEFTLVLLDPYIEAYSSGAPALKLGFNAVIAGMIFPLHSFFEERLKQRLMSS